MNPTLLRPNPPMSSFPSLCDCRFQIGQKRRESRVFIIRVTDRTQSLIDHSHELHLSQILMGMRIRIRDGREKPIDRLMKNILLLDVHSHFFFFT